MTRPRQVAAASGATRLLARRARWGVLAVLGLILVGIALRLHQAGTRSLEYDEIWTLQEYSTGPVKPIFTHLATPNNHPLHSLLVRGSVGVFGYSPFATRLPAWLAGCALLALLPWLAWRFTGSGAAAIAASALAAANAPLLHFSQTARGYTLQTLLLYAWLALVLEALRRRRRPLELAALALAPVLATLTLATSILWLAPMGLLLLGWLWQEQPPGPARQRLARLITVRRTVLLACLAGALGSLVWLALAMPQLRQAQARFGNPITAPGELWHQALEMLPLLAGYPVLALAVLAVVVARDRRLVLAAWLVALAPFALAVVTSMGPARAYLASVPALILAAAAAVPALAARCPPHWQARLAGALNVAIAIAALGLMPHGLGNWRPPDWPMAHRRLTAELPADIYPVFPAGAGLTIQFRDPVAAPTANLRRLLAARRLGTVGHQDVSVRNCAHSGEELLLVPPSVQPTPIRLGGEQVWVYTLQPLAAAPPLELALVVAALAPAGADFTVLRDAIWGEQRQAWGALNGFTSWFPPDAQGQRAGAAVYARLADAAELARLRALDEQGEGLRCFVLASATTTP